MYWRFLFLGGITKIESKMEKNTEFYNHKKQKKNFEEQKLISY